MTAVQHEHRPGPVDGGLALPTGFGSYVSNVGIKDDTDDLVVVCSDRPASASGLFTRSSFAGPSVLVSREHVASGTARAVVVISKNANVATGEQGLANAREVTAMVAGRLGVEATDVLVASTGVIGRQYPMDRVRAGIARVPSVPSERDARRVAQGIMTTDTVAKTAEATAGAARVVGVAKGVGMIEPDMATLITLVFTDAEVAPAELDAMFRRVIDRTFNCVSVDTDTSTSDTAIVLANGAAGPVDPGELEAALHAVTLSLTKQVARDGEGAEKLLEVHVHGARDGAQAKRVAKAIVNSPLVKTAVHGADPNWGRVAMAVGKATSADEVDQRAVVIRFGTQEVYPAAVGDDGLEALAEYMRGDEVRIDVALGSGDAEATVWGCDLSAGYVRINADYTT
ncbi:MAG: bifunctional glutamate N-acetyltransferase/amino-acid acetyltransferase ArgJ [Actinobacteria bacterium]|nr:bifunctional glutamate N-acetyltransferase/amino-acid acetyltransferase ArgJ [Actinomycetota bacterium]